MKYIIQGQEYNHMIEYDNGDYIYVEDIVDEKYQGRFFYIWSNGKEFEKGFFDEGVQVREGIVYNSAEKTITVFNYRDGERKEFIKMYTDRNEFFFGVFKGSRSEYFIDINSLIDENLYDYEIEEDSEDLNQVFDNFYDTMRDTVDELNKLKQENDETIERLKYLKDILSN